MSKKVLSLVLALVMVLGTLGTAFADTAEAPAINEKIEKLKAMGLVQGYEDGTYGLENPITRAEMATMIVRSLGLESAATASAAFPSQFSDMNGANVLWARGYVNVAVGQGVVKGYPEGTFLPANNVTYAEAIAMLVRAGNHITAAEEAVAVWPATYLTKAAQIGLLNGVEGIVDYNAPALRGKLFELVYNAAEIGGNLFVASTVEGIVVENYRTERLNKDEVIVHTMEAEKVVSSSDKDANTKYHSENEEINVKITEELAKKGYDVEYLLGKVVKISFDRNHNIVDVTVNNTYNYVSGAVDLASDKKIEVAEKEYTVGKDEGREARDERLYQVYSNNKDVEYDDLVGKKDDEPKVEFAKITVKNGKVLFIDAFQFDDIAPVSKDVDDRDRVSYYDDSKDGTVVSNADIGKDYVLNFVAGELRVGNKADIVAGDVIHFFGKTVIVRPLDDNKVEGELARLGDNRKDQEVKYTIDDEAYVGLAAESYTKYNRNTVYALGNKDQEYKTVQYTQYSKQLSDFRGEEVTLLRDVKDNVQLITSDRIDASFLALVQNRWTNGEFKLFTENNESNIYDSTLRSTTIKLDGKKANFNDYDAYEALVKDSLVRATANDEDMLTQIDILTLSAPDTIYLMNKNDIQLGANAADELPISRKAVVFTTDSYRAYSVADFLKAYGKDNEITKDELNAKNPLIAKLYVKDGIVEVIVVTNAGGSKDSTKTLKVLDARVSKDDYELQLEDKDGIKEWYVLDYADADDDYEDLAKKENRGKFIKVELSKDKAIIASPVEVNTNGPFRILSINSAGRVTLTDNVYKNAAPLRVVGDEFGTISKGMKVVVALDDQGRISLIAETTKAGFGDLEDILDMADLLGINDSESEEVEETGTTVEGKFRMLDDSGRVTEIQIGNKVYDYVGRQSITVLERMLGEEVIATLDRDGDVERIVLK